MEFAQSNDLVFDGVEFFRIFVMLQGFVHELDDDFGRLLVDTARRHSLHPEPQSRRSKGRIWVIRDGRLGGRDTYFVEGLFCDSAVHIGVRKIDNNHMVVRTAGDELVSELGEGLSHDFSILEGLTSILPEGRCTRLVECDRNGRYRIHMWTTLCTRKHRSVDTCRDIFDRIFGLLEGIGDDTLGEDESASGSPERFVCRRHHDLKSMIEGIW